MSAPTPYVIRLQTPVPVIVHGQVPITTHTALPVVEQHWPEPDPFSKDALIVAVIGLFISLVAAGAAIAAAIYAGRTFDVAKRELEVVETELQIIGKQADLHLSSLDDSNTITAPTFWMQYPDSHRYYLGRYSFEVTPVITNSGSRAVPEVILYLWLPPRVSPQALSQGWKNELRSLDIAGDEHHLFTYAVERRIYTKPFRTVERISLMLEIPKPAKAHAQPPTSVTFYWQLVCDDGTFPKEPADLTVRLGQTTYQTP